MLPLNLGFGTIYCCNRDEARKLWIDEPKNRGRIWLQDEVKKYTLADKETLEAAYRKRLANPKAAI